MSNFKYIINNTEHDNSFLKSVIQASTGDFAHQKDVTELLENIEMFFQKEVKNNPKDIIREITTYLGETIGKYPVLKGNNQDIYDLYILTSKKDKKIFPVFSSKLKADLNKNSIFFTFQKYKYLQYYLIYRIESLDNKYKKISLRDYINHLLSNNDIKYNLILDIFNLNIILLDKNLTYNKTYKNPKNTKYIILYQDDKRYKNVTLDFEDRKINLLDSKEDADIIDAIENNNYIGEKTEYKYKKMTNLDSIIEDIQNSSYSKEDFLSNVNLLD